MIHMGPYYPGGPAPLVKRESRRFSDGHCNQTRVPPVQAGVRTEGNDDRPEVPMRRTAWLSLALAAILIPSSPVPSSAHSSSHSNHAYSYGFNFDEDEDFGWAVIIGGKNSSSNISDWDVVNELKEKYDGDFLYIRDGKDQYVIRDQRYVQRAQATSSEISKYGSEVGKLARAQAKLALSHIGVSGQRLSLERAARELEREIRHSERDGESTQGLKRALRHIQEELDSLPDDDHETLSASEREDLRRQSDDAQKHLQDAVRKMRRDMRDILREAKERGKAEKLDAKDWKSF